MKIPLTYVDKFVKCGIINSVNMFDALYLCIRERAYLPHYATQKLARLWKITENDNDDEDMASWFPLPSSVISCYWLSGNSIALTCCRIARQKCFTSMWQFKYSVVHAPAQQVRVRIEHIGTCLFRRLYLLLKHHKVEITYLFYLRRRVDLHTHPPYTSYISS